MFPKSIYIVAGLDITPRCVLLFAVLPFARFQYKLFFPPSAPKQIGVPILEQSSKHVMYYVHVAYIIYIIRSKLLIRIDERVL